MKFLQPTIKKILLTILFFIILVFISMKFGTQAFVWSDEKTNPNPPVHFKLNPFLWLPSYIIFKNDITDFTIRDSFLYTIPYWLIISYFISCLLLKKVPPSPKVRRGVGGEV